jgi:hypothetical protein
MSTSEIKTAVMNLTKDEFLGFIEWLDDYQESLWDKQIEADMISGRLNHLILEAKKEFREGKCRQI